MYRHTKSLKKKCSLAICLATLGLLAGCDASGKTADRSSNQKSEIERVMEEKMAAENADAGNKDADNVADENAESDGSQAEVAQDAQSDNAKTQDGSKAAASYSSDQIEVDLSAISGDVVYAQVYDMMTKPEDYIGKVVKMKGNYAFYHDEASNIDYHACIIQDATACCAQGIEFEPVTGFTSQTDRPADNEEITVTGVFDTYMDGEYEYCTLRKADVEG